MSFQSALDFLFSGLSRARRAQRPPQSRSFRPRLEALEDRCVPATLNVTSNLDNGASGTLRWAVGHANASGTADTIDILTTQTIVLTQGQLQLSHSMTIEASAGTATISGGGNSRVFYCFQASGQLTLSNLNITNGTANQGGGIYNYSSHMTLTDCTVSGNSATNGGGIYFAGSGNPGGASGNMLITNCTLSQNSASNGGGGIYIGAGNGPVTITSSIVSNNSARGGGGIDNASPAGEGGALFIQADQFFGNSPNNITGSYQGRI